MLLEILHAAMVIEPNEAGRRDPSDAIMLWRRAKEHSRLIASPAPFIKLAKLLLAAQASSAAVERMFSVLKAIEVNQTQALMTTKLNKMEIVRVLIAN